MVQSRLPWLSYLLHPPAQGGGDPRERPGPQGHSGSGTQQPHDKRRTGANVRRFRVSSATRPAPGSFQSHASHECRKSTSGAKDSRAQRRGSGRGFRTSEQSSLRGSAPPTYSEGNVQTVCGTNAPSRLLNVVVLPTAMCRNAYNNACEKKCKIAIYAAVI